MEQQNLTKEERLKKFQEMGIPIPMEKINPLLTSSRPGNSHMHKVLESIKSGAKKSEFSGIIETKPNKGFEPLPVNVKSKNKPKQPSDKTPEVKSFSGAAKGSAEAKQLESVLFGGAGGGSSAVSTGANLEENYIKNIPEEDILTKFRERMSNKQITQTNNIVQEQKVNHQANHFNLSEEEFRRKVISISKQVAMKVSKTMIKNVILEYVKSGQDIIVESTRCKKAEIVDKNKVRIEGKVYKLVPIK